MKGVAGEDELRWSVGGDVFGVVVRLMVDSPGREAKGMIMMHGAAVKLYATPVPSLSSFIHSSNHPHPNPEMKIIFLFSPSDLEVCFTYVCV